MLRIEKFVTASPEQMEMVIEGMRNPKNSWDRMDSGAIDCDHMSCDDCPAHVLEVCSDRPQYDFFLGPDDHKLMMSLAKGGPVHAKYRRMMPVWVTINAPLYWWKEFDTYKVGTVANSCSTMHKIGEKEFTLEDFSHEHLIDADDPLLTVGEVVSLITLEIVISALNFYRNKFLKAKTKPMKDESKRAGLVKKYWWQMIQLLPTSYMQKRTVFLNYEVLYAMRKDRRHHKLDEWHVFCDWIENLPYSELITLER